MNNARQLCQKGKELFATPCKTDFFPSRKGQALLAIRKASYVSNKDKKTIRAAHLADATDADIAYLESLPTALVVDFRTEVDLKGKPDKHIPGAEYVSIPIDASGSSPVFSAGSLKRKTVPSARVMTMPRSTAPSGIFELTSSFSLQANSSAMAANAKMTFYIMFQLCIRYSFMKSFRSPSSTPWVSAVSHPVRRSLTIL